MPRRLCAVDYRRAVREAGGVPVLIGKGDEESALNCDALIFSGGVDIQPSLFPLRKEDAALRESDLARQNRISVDPKRDAYELPLARKALAGSMPVLGICRGMQTLNVAAGGALILHLPAWSSSVQHRFPRGTQRPIHNVETVAGSDFASLAGDGEMTVNSYHHQGISEAELAPGLKAVAHSADGLIEALEMQGHPYFFAVQWHPERAKDAEVRERFRVLFEELISAARNRRR